MPLRLEAIEFNHDQRSATVDAFNIRKNETEFVKTPEWRRGNLKPGASLAAYARSETEGHTLTIKANFSFDGDEKQSVLIRALDANFHKDTSGSPLSPEELQLLKDLVSNPEGNVLGAVKATPVTVGKGETDFQSFKLESVRIWDAGVGADNIVWRWQYLPNGATDWIDLAVTTHRIYTTLHLPTLPWLPSDHTPENTHLPWAEVLDQACDWARTAKNTDEATTRITTRVNGFGQKRLICYDGSASYTDVTAFDCTAFLELLKRKHGRGTTVNCDDCAAIVSTFANSIGCDLVQMCIGPVADIKSDFGVKPHQRIGEDDVKEKTAFFHHSVAANGCGESAEVFDACLQFVTPSNEGPRVFTLPTSLAFMDGKGGYHFRLVEPADQPITKASSECKRRQLGRISTVEEACIIRKVLEERFEFSSWKEADAPGTKFLISEFLLSKYILSFLQVESLQESGADVTPRVIHSICRSALYGSDKFFRLDLYEADSWQAARETLMKVLAALALPGIERKQMEEMGDVTFADEAFENIIFAAGNLVVHLRNQCIKVGPLTEVARLITQKILNVPLAVSDDLVPPDSVKRFSFTSDKGKVETNIELREEPADPHARPRFYQFLAKAGELSREHGQFMYRPACVGSHTLEIFAVDGNGNAIRQTLTLTVT